MHIDYKGMLLNLGKKHWYCTTGVQVAIFLMDILDIYINLRKKNSRTPTFT